MQMNYMLPKKKKLNRDFETSDRVYLTQTLVLAKLHEIAWNKLERPRIHTECASIQNLENS